jgi:hypothetical protein
LACAPPRLVRSATKSLRPSLRGATLAVDQRPVHLETANCDRRGGPRRGGSRPGRARPVCGRGCRCRRPRKQMKQSSKSA